MTSAGQCVDGGLFSFTPYKQSPMAAIKQYLLTLLQNCSDEPFGQDAVEHAIMTGKLQLTYNMETDLHQIFDQRSACCEAPPHGAVTTDHSRGLCAQCRRPSAFKMRYDDFINAYQATRQRNLESLTDSYSGLLEEILRPAPLAVTHGKNLVKA